jgi:hypothetical protein
MLMLSPTLRSVHIDAGEETRARSVGSITFLSAAADAVAMTLEHLVLEDTYSPTIFKIIPRFLNLQSLKIGDIQKNIPFQAFALFLQEISPSNQITSLILSQIPEDRGAPQLALPAGTFSMLTKMDISGGFEFILQLISGIASLRLRDITLTFTSEPQRRPRPQAQGKTKRRRPDIEDKHHPWTSIYTLLGERWDSSLERIVIKLAGLQGPLVFGVLFGGLWRLENLREFRLVGEPRIIIEERDIVTLVTSWPHLVILGITVGPQSSADGPPFFPISTLAYFAMHLPSLRELEISIDPTDLTPPTIETFLSTHRLERLTVLPRSILTPSQISKIAQFLDNNFPHLHVKGPSWEPEEGWLAEDREWLAVDALLKLLQSARAQERRRMLRSSV